MSRKIGFADINGLKMYYEIHGRGRPIVLLHGGFSSIAGSFKKVIPKLARKYKIIAIEQQGHGHTADIDRAMTYEQMAQDTAALLKSLKIKQADFFGWSDGGHVAIGVAVKHPRLVRKLAFSGAHADALKKIMPAEIFKHFKKFSAEQLPSFMQRQYSKTSPKPERWPMFVEKVREMGLNFKGYSSQKIKKLNTPTLIMSGDQDVIELESLVSLYKSMKNASLAVIPEDGHSWLVNRPELFVDLLSEFFDSPLQRQRGGW